MASRASAKWRPLNPAFTRKNRTLSRVHPTDLDDEAHMDRLMQDKKFRRLVFSGPNPWERSLALSAEFPPPTRPTSSGDLIATLSERWDDVLSRPKLYDRVLLAFEDVPPSTLASSELQVLQRFVQKVIYRLAHGTIHWRVAIKFVQFCCKHISRHAEPADVAVQDVDRGTSLQLHAEAVAAAAAVGGVSDTSTAVSSSTVPSTSSAFDSAAGAVDAYARWYDDNEVEAHAETAYAAPYSPTSAGAIPTFGGRSSLLADVADDIGDGDADGGGGGDEGGDRGGNGPRRRATHDLFDVPLALRGVTSSRASSLRRLRAAEGAEATYTVSTPLGSLSGRLPDNLFGGMGVAAAGVPLPTASAGPRATSNEVAAFISVLYYGVEVVAARVAAFVEAGPDAVDDKPTGKTGTPWKRTMQIAAMVSSLDAVVCLPATPSPAAADASPPGEEVSPSRVVPGRLRPLAVRLLEAAARRRAYIASLPGGHSHAFDPEGDEDEEEVGGEGGETEQMGRGNAAKLRSGGRPGHTTPLRNPEDSPSHTLGVWGGVPSQALASAMKISSTRPALEGSSVTLIAGAHVAALRALGTPQGAHKASAARLGDTHATSASAPDTDTLTASVDRLLTAAVYVGGVRNEVLDATDIMSLLKALVAGYYSGRLPAGFVTSAATEVVARVSLSTTNLRLDFAGDVALSVALLGAGNDDCLDTITVGWTGAATALQVASPSDPARAAGSFLWALARAGRADVVAYSRVCDELASNTARPRHRRKHIEERTELAPDQLGSHEVQPLLRSSSAGLATLAWCVATAAPYLSPNARPGGRFWRQLFFACRERQKLQHMTSGGPGTNLTLPPNAPPRLRAADVAVIGWAFAVTGQSQWAAQLLEPLAMHLPLIPPASFPPLSAMAFEWAWRLVCADSFVSLPSHFQVGPLLRSRVASSFLFCGEAPVDTLRDAPTQELQAAALRKGGACAAVALPRADAPGAVDVKERMYDYEAATRGVESTQRMAAEGAVDRLQQAFAAYHHAFSTRARAARCARDLFAWCGITGDIARTYRRVADSDDPADAASTISSPPPGLCGAGVAIPTSLRGVEPPTLSDLAGISETPWPAVEDVSSSAARSAIPRAPLDIRELFGEDGEEIDGGEGGGGGALLPAFAFAERGGVSASAFSDMHIDVVGTQADRFDSRLRLPTSAIWPRAEMNLRTGEGLSVVEAGEAAVAARVSKEAAEAERLEAEASYNATRTRASDVLQRVGSPKEAE